MHYTTAAEAVKLIRSNDSVYIQGSTSIPEALVAAMAERGGELEHVTVYSAFAVGAFDAPYCRPEYKESFLVNSLFVANNIRRWLADGYGQTIPAFLGEIPALFRDGTLPLDVALINVSPPDAEGYCSFGVSADLAVSAVECAKTIIAQVNKAMPYSYGDAVIHVSRLAAAVEVDSPLVEVPTAVPSETERKIGSYIAELIPDGATLQIGVGGIPNAVLAALGGHRHLGLHTEAMTDGVLPLLESGVIDNSQKAVMPGVTVASLALGSRRLYDYMDYRKDRRSWPSIRPWRWTSRGRCAPTRSECASSRAWAASTISCTVGRCPKAARPSSPSPRPRPRANRRSGRCCRPAQASSRRATWSSMSSPNTAWRTCGAATSPNAPGR